MRVSLALSTLFAAASALAQISVAPADAIVPVVGSTRGQSNANFKTELQMANSTDFPMRGWLVLRPHGVVQRYDLPAHSTLSFADVVAEMGGAGLGSMDILIDEGPLPTIVTRAYDDQPTGTTGVTVPIVRTASLLNVNHVAPLIVPRDLVAYRFNIGVRALKDGVTLELRLRSANGTERHRRILTFGEDHFEQQRGDLLVGSELQANDSIEIRIIDGSAVVYATTVDNRTNDSSIQLATRPQ